MPALAPGLTARAHDAGSCGFRAAHRPVFSKTALPAERGLTAADDLLQLLLCDLDDALKLARLVGIAALGKLVARRRQVNHIAWLPAPPLGPVLCTASGKAVARSSSRRAPRYSVKGCSTTTPMTPALSAASRATACTSVSAGLRGPLGNVQRCPSRVRTSRNCSWRSRRRKQTAAATGLAVPTGSDSRSRARRVRELGDWREISIPFP